MTIKSIHNKINLIQTFGPMIIQAFYQIFCKLVRRLVKLFIRLSANTFICKTFLKRLFGTDYNEHYWYYSDIFVFHWYILLHFTTVWINQHQRKFREWIWLCDRYLLSCNLSKLELIDTFISFFTGAIFVHKRWNLVV